ncbi:MAG: YjbQ family protein [Actinomycetes bacterium]
MDSVVLQVRTGQQFVTDLTANINRFVAERGSGLVNIFVPHATAGVAIIETGANVEPDLADAVERLLPVADIYRHRHGSRGHGRDHLLPAFVAPSITIPVLDGAPALGIWQSVVLIDSNRDNPDREVRLSFLTDERR